MTSGAGGGRRDRVEPESQRGILHVPFDVLVKLLGLPDGHVVERVTVTESPYQPGLMVSVAGRAMPLNHPLSPLMIEDYRAFIKDAEQRVQASLKQWPPTE